MGDESRSIAIEPDVEVRSCQLTRRRFLSAAGTGGAVAVAMLTVPGCGQMLATTTRLPEQRVGNINDLKVDVPVNFTFPDKRSIGMLVKLGVPAGGGVGPAGDIVAFSATCPHMGTPLIGAYNAKHKGMGPCPSHLTRFDLTRYGIVISGHATESLPQILLEVDESGEIYANGVRGLIYGRAENVV